MFVRMAATALAAAVVSIPAQGVKYAGLAIGPEVGLVICGDTDPVDAAFDAGVVVHVKMDLGRYGAIHYRPGAGVWFGGHTDDTRVSINNVWYVYEYSYFALETRLDIADFSYYFPIPQEFIVRPFAGLGPMLAIDYYSYEADDPRDWIDDSWDDTDVHVGFNIMAGADFRINQRVSAFVEMRARPAHWDAFKFGGGILFAVGG